ncbi:MAG: nucleoside-diphosphate sugar epimerase/dehydratase, partial [Lachnospiraceae bacterium]
MNKQKFNSQLFYRRAGLMIYDVASILAASFLAIVMRYEFEIGMIPSYFLEPIAKSLPFNIILTLVIFYLFRLYHSLWAFAGENELQNVVVACFLASAVNGILLFLFRVQPKPVPSSYYFMYAFLLITFTFASRFSYRFFRNKKHKLQNKNNTTRVMIIGAGEAGNAIIKEIVSSNYSTMSIGCIIDDDSKKWGSFIQGIRVAGGRDKILECVDLYGIDEIFIAIPSASKMVIREILEICKETECKLRSLPGIYQLVNGEVNVSQLRDV